MLSWDFWEDVRKEEKVRQIIGKAGIGFGTGMMLVNFSYSFIPVCQGYANEKSILASAYTPFGRDDIDTLHDMKDYLNQLTDGTDSIIYVSASGTVLNCDILRKMDMPYSNNAIPRMCGTADVDLRDGFPALFLISDYVVTTEPVQVHLGSGQEVVSYLVEGVNDPNSYIGRHFEQINEFSLGDGVAAKIYHKTSDWDEEDLTKLSDYYTELYPGYEALFRDRILN